MNLDYQNVKDRLQNKGYRDSKLRKLILEILDKKDTSLTAKEIIHYLKHYQLFPNKTSIYRQLETLVVEGIVQEFGVFATEKTYSIMDSNISCQLAFKNEKKLSNAEMDPKIMDELREYFKNRYDFEVENLQLTLFGNNASDG
jgi:Fe2+ or Zn2+ uptake regulation protein